MAKETKKFSLRTADATDGGGIEGALATITEIGFVDEFTYGGRQKDNPQAALRLVYTIDGFDRPWEQHHSVGPSEKYEVIAGGDGIKPVGKSAGLNRKCSAYAFFTAVEEAATEAGLDLDELLPEIEDEGTQSIRPLEGRRVRLTNIKFETVGGEKKDLPVIGAFVDDEAPAAKGKGGKATAKAAKSASSEDIEAKTVAAIEALIEEHTSVKKGDLANLVYTANKKDADVKAMMNQCFKDAWLADDARPWTFDKKKGLLRAV